MKAMRIKEKNITFFQANKLTIIPFIVSFMLFMSYCILKNNTKFYWDSDYYWILANNFYSNEKFSLTEFFPQSIRGYFLPFLLFLFKGIGLNIFTNSYVGLWLLNSLSFSIILIILLEIFSEKKSMSVKKAVISSIIFSLLIIIFYGWVLIYPMSDNISLMLFLLAIYVSIKQLKNKLTNNIKYFFVGGLLYACYNVRPAYLIAIIIFVFAWSIFILKNKCDFVINLILICLGIFIVALPQSIINNTYLQTYSPLIIFSYAGSKSLNLAQLFTGLGYNSYQTTIAPFHNYPVPGIASVNRTGEIIKSVENITADNISYLEIIKLILKYPLEMIGIYFAHFTRELFIIDPDGYIKDMSKNLSLIFLINSVVLYLMGLFMMTFKIEENTNNEKKVSWFKQLKLVDKRYVYFFCPAITALLTIPGAVETRFFIYIHIIIYFVLSFIVQYKNLFKIFKRYYIKITISFLCFIAIFSSILSYNLASLSPEGLTFSLNPYAINNERQIESQIKNNVTPYIPKSAVYENGYLPPSFIFITKTAKDGKISFSTTFDKDITELHDISIYINGKLENKISEIKKGTYDFEFTVEPNNINSVQIECSYYFIDELNRKSSFKLDDLKLK